jgi:CubicO group peptidase (beta-lactamase class C family)
MKLFRPLLLPAAIVTLLAGLILTTMPALAETPGQLDTQAIDTYLQSQVKTNRIPGLAVAIVEGDKVTFQKGYGDATAGKPVTPQTQFYIGSVSKGFTALAAMKLVEQGKLDLDAPVQMYIPWFIVDDPQASALITIRNLLNHTSGLTEKGDPNASAYTASLEEQVRLLQFVKPTTPAGTTYEYYNQNYRILGYVVEQVSGQPYAEFLKENVLLPLGMKHTVTNPADAPDLAQGHSRFFSFPLPMPQEYIPSALPSGYMITTAEDMSYYLTALLNNRQPDGQPVLREDLLTLMRTPPSCIKSDYGMGWMVADNGNTLIHGGAIHTFQSFVAMGLKEKAGFVVLYNQNSMENMMFENSTINSGLVDLLNGKTPATGSKAWVGMVLLILALADLANHVRLFRLLPRWVEKTARQSRLWLWIKVSLGILFPLTIFFGLPILVNTLEGGSPTWSEPFKLMPDLITWLLLGLGLNCLRSIFHAISLVQKPADIQKGEITHENN